MTGLGACLIDQVQPGLRMAAYLLDALRGLVGGQLVPVGADVSCPVFPALPVSDVSISYTGADHLGHRPLSHMYESSLQALAALVYQGRC